MPKRNTRIEELLARGKKMRKIDPDPWMDEAVVNTVVPGMPIDQALQTPGSGAGTPDAEKRRGNLSNETAPSVVEI